METILEAMQTIKSDIEVHFYGTPTQPELVKKIDSDPRMKYGGQLAKHEIESVLQEADVLLLPTKWIGEGLPGVVIEAFQCGLPVIATRWMQIPELISDGTDGILIEPDSTTELAAAMQSMIDDDNRLSSMSTAAIEKGNQFNSMTWNTKLVSWCEELTKQTKHKPNQENQSI